MSVTPAVRITFKCNMVCVPLEQIVSHLLSGRSDPNGGGIVSTGLGM